MFRLSRDDRKDVPVLDPPGQYSLEAGREAEARSATAGDRGDPGWGSVVSGEARHTAMRIFERVNRRGTGARSRRANGDHGFVGRGDHRRDGAHLGCTVGPSAGPGRDGRTGLSGAVFEAQALVAGLDDVAAMGEPVEQGGRHFGVAKDARPFAESEFGRDDEGSVLVEPDDQMEQELAAGARKGKFAEFVENRKVELLQVPGKLSAPAWPSGLPFRTGSPSPWWCRAHPRAVADAVAGDVDAEMGFAETRSPEQHDVALAARNAPVARSRAPIVDRRPDELERIDLLGQGQPGGCHLVLERAGTVLGDLGFENVTDDLLDRQPTFDRVGSQACRMPVSRRS